MELTPPIILGVIGAYFLLLLVIARVTSKGADDNTFFVGNRKSPWFLVAFGMIGASLSGVTFISIPGWVGGAGFGYFQMVLGYLFGYAFIALVLIPVYYKLNLTSIYTYLLDRLGFWSYKTGAAYFLLSRVIGASFRLYLVAGVLQAFVFDKMGVPFEITVAITILFIWIYTFKGGIKTIVWTDTLQTLFMLVAVGLAVILITKDLNLSFSEILAKGKELEYTKIFFFDVDIITSKAHFIKQFLGGALIAIVMTGLDQDMMQKNLSCKNIKDAQKNIFTMSWLLVPINLLFLFLGALLYLFALKNNIEIPAKTDHLFPLISLSYMPIYVGIIFLLGLIAAAYSSADSALTSLTTSFCIDFLDFEKKKRSPKETKKTRLFVHIGFSILLAIVIYCFKYLGNDAVITKIFIFAMYTYGPLFGLFMFGLFTKLKVYDKLVPVVCILSPILTYLVVWSSEKLFGFQFGNTLVLVNGGITFVGLLTLGIIKKMTDGENA